MSYEPTTWKAGDTVTSEKLNKIEQGVSASFSNVNISNPTNGQILIYDGTSGKWKNRINNSSIIFETVFVADPNNTYIRYYETIDDVDDIVTAYKNGKNVLFHLPRQAGYAQADMWLSMIGYIDALDDDLEPLNPGICIMNNYSHINLSNNTTNFPEFSEVLIVNGKLQIKLYID